MSTIKRIMPAILDIDDNDQDMIRQGLTRVSHAAGLRTYGQVIHFNKKEGSNEKILTIVSWVVLMMLFYPVNGQCLDVAFHGQVSSLFVLRDIDGFQSGFLDENRGVQWRNTLEFDLTLKPEYKPGATYYVDKVFMSYRGAYDAIFELTDRYDDVREKSPDDFELGRDDIEWENDLREIFVDLVAEEGMTKVNLRLGRQIVRWGETDIFNVLNVVNPSDNSFQMFFQDPDDTAIPLWMARLNYNVVGVGFLTVWALSFLRSRIFGRPSLRRWVTERTVHQF